MRKVDSVDYNFKTNIFFENFKGSQFLNFLEQTNFNLN